jgi:hypothetical protein
MLSETILYFCFRAKSKCELTEKQRIIEKWGTLRKDDNKKKVNKGEK